MAKSISTSTDTPALVFGTGITVLGVIRSLAKSGINPYCLSDRLDFIKKSRYCKHLPIDEPFIHSPKEFILFLERLPLEKAVLIPCSDEWVAAISQMPDRLKEKFRSCTPSAETVRMLVNKGKLYQRLAELKMPHPYTLGSPSEVDPDTLWKDKESSYFLKPCDSENFFRRFWTKAFKVDSKDELAKRLKQVRDAKLEVVLQEYIPGPQSNHVFVDGFVDRSGNWCAAFARRRRRIYPKYFGNSSYFETIPVEAASTQIDNLKRLFSSINYRGVFSAEFKTDERDGKPRLIEVNVRPWWYIEFTERCGVPISKMIYLDALDRSIEPVLNYKPGVKMIYPYIDLYSSYELWKEGKLGIFSWLKSFVTAKQAVFRITDPLPSLSWSWDEAMRIFRRKFLRQKK